MKTTRYKCLFGCADATLSNEMKEEIEKVFATLKTTIGLYYIKQETNNPGFIFAAFNKRRGIVYLATSQQQIKQYITNAIAWHIKMEIQNDITTWNGNEWILV